MNQRFIVKKAFPGMLIGKVVEEICGEYFRENSTEKVPYNPKGWHEYFETEEAAMEFEKTENKKKVEHGGFAFPANSPDGLDSNQGLTKREWFVGMAIQGMLAHNCNDLNRIQNGSEVQSSVAKKAFLMADAIIQEGKK